MPLGMTLFFWVIEGELSTGLDAHLLSSVLKWIESSWPFEAVMVPKRNDDKQGIRIGAELGLPLTDRHDLEDRMVYLWSRQ